MATSRSTRVRSKLLVPATAGLLHRPRVCQAIERGLACKLTLLSAPAGYGKTSALADFAQHSPVPVCWYTADERERDVSAFGECLVGAIGARFPGVGRRIRARLAGLGDDPFRDLDGVVGALVNEMLEIETHFAVVVDNYEALEGAPGIRTLMHRLVEVLPVNCHLMLGSRVLPDVPITLLVARRQLAGLTERDLRFAGDEVHWLLRQSGVAATREQAEALAGETEGWVMGVLLLAGRLREEVGGALLGAGATAETYGYLAREVLERQPGEVREFLCISALLREMTERLCREALGMRGAGGLLGEVERRNLFVTRYGQGRGAVYRYHALFRGFLGEQLRREDAACYAELHRRAGEWFAGQEEVEEAVYHYVAAEAWEEAAGLMERVALEWFTRGRVEILLQWGEALPERERGRAPRLLLYESKVLTDRYDYAGARRALALAEAGFAVREDAVGLAKVHNQRATLGVWEGRYADALAEAETALGLLSAEEVQERATVQRYIGRACVGLSRFVEGIAHLRDALALYRQVGSLYDVVNSLQDLALAHTSEGDLAAARVCLGEALPIARRFGATVQLAGVLNELGYICYLEGRCQESLALYEEGLATAQRGVVLQLQTYISIGLGDLYRDAGAYERAETLYDAGLRIARESEPGLAVYVLAARADMVRWQGDNTRALDILAEARRLAEEKGLAFEQGGLLALGEGMTRAESGEVAEGLRLLEDGVTFLEQRGARRELARGRFLLAKAHWLGGDEAQAAVELRRALALGEEMGAWQFAAAEGQHAEGLLRLGVGRGVVGSEKVLEGIADLRAFWGEQERVEGGERAEEEGGRLEVYALGGGRVVREGWAVASAEWQAALVKELFFYVLLHGPLERDAIGAVFWPELPAKKVRNNFHIALHRLRQAVGADVVVVEDGRYRLGEVEYWFDVEEFEGLVERARLLPVQDWQAEHLWKRAVGLYGGDFLPEVERVWCVARRERLREMHVEALVGLGRCYEARREYGEAVVWYGRALEVDELREDVHRLLMGCYVAAGRRADALAQYRRCRDVLKRELGIAPAPETRALYEQIAGKKTDKDLGGLR